VFEKKIEMRGGEGERGRERERGREKKGVIGDSIPDWETLLERSKLQIKAQLKEREKEHVVLTVPKSNDYPDELSSKLIELIPADFYCNNSEYKDAIDSYSLPLRNSNDTAANRSIFGNIQSHTTHHNYPTLSQQFESGSFPIQIEQMEGLEGQIRPELSGAEENEEEADRDAETDDAEFDVEVHPANTTFFLYSVLCNLKNRVINMTNLNSKMAAETQYLASSHVNTILSSTTNAMSNINRTIQIGLDYISTLDNRAAERYHKSWVSNAYRFNSNTGFKSRHKGTEKMKPLSSSLPPEILLRIFNDL
jgi:hypothetical protein